MIKSLTVDRSDKTFINLLEFNKEDYSQEANNRSCVVSRFIWHDHLSKINKIEFKPGVNLVYSPNGSGKSTIIEVIATYMHSKQVYRSLVTAHSMQDFFDMGDFCRLELLKKDSNSHKLFDFLKLAHDGQSVQFFDPSHRQGLLHEGREFDFDGDFKLGIQANLGSSGQNTLERIKQFFEAGKKTTEVEFKTKNAYECRRKDSLLGLEATILKGKPTLVFDEPTRSLDIEQEVKFWELVQQYSEFYQIIVVTHSLMALDIKGANYIELVEGSIQKYRDTVNMLYNGQQEK